MKIIFKETVSGKGNKNEIKDVANGYATYLIRQGKAVVASDENIKDLEQVMEMEKMIEEQRIAQAESTKKYLENLTNIKFYQKALPDGSTKESITKKDVLKALNDLNLIAFEDVIMKPIKQFGVFDISIKVYKSIKATVKIQILSQD